MMATNAIGQGITIRGQVLDALGKPVADVFILASSDSSSTLTNQEGMFSIILPSEQSSLTFSHIRYETVRNSIVSNNIKIILHEKIRLLSGVNIERNRYEQDHEIGNIQISARNAYTLPSATGDFSNVLRTLPGVTSNNELSTVYAVRGGNYDENLIYVNGIKIYRPFLISAGRQEGLSFVNSDMVSDVQFSAGGWQSKYGDKMSSVLNVRYAEPQKNEATVNLSLLGGSIYYGGVNKKKGFNFSAGLRHKNTKYLLGTLETNGEYKPKFSDIQSYLSKRLSDKTKIGLLMSYASNDYSIIPTTSQTEFGTINASYRMTVAFEGQEKVEYDTYQGGIILAHAFGQKFLSTLSVSGVYSSEKENSEIEGAYLLCNLDNNPSSNNLNDCVTIIGTGANYAYSRNKLEAKILSIDQKNEIQFNNDLLEFGMSWDYENLDDRLKEFAFTDSADYSTVTLSINNEIDIQSHKIAGFVQYTLMTEGERQTINFGVRLNYRSFSGELLISPRIQYAHQLGLHKSTILRFSTGLYQQHAFYRELRNREGDINENIKAQSSYHVVGGVDHYFSAWGRPFKLMTDAYYKYLWNINPYDINNIKIRYFGTNQATAYAYGVDFRVNGEFISGTESWFSLGILKTNENIQEGNGYKRRPSDQRVNLGIFFQDHMPNDPSLKASINLLFGSGLPFGPPNNDEKRNSFSGDEYYRLDLGFSKNFIFKNNKSLIPNSLWIGLEVLNVLGANNTISYTWIQDVVGNQFAVPNTLSARFLNARLITKF